MPAPKPKNRAKKAVKPARAPKEGTSVIDDYLASLSGERREALERLRRTIRAALPRAEECMSYGLPAFRVDGEVVAGFAATRKGCSYYPFSSATLQTLASEVAAYQTSKGALQFDAKEPLPAALVRRLIRVRRAEVAPSKAR
jgi:uncharacterized protein YdhG (YjbR/CyaY superfamily)